MKIGVIVAIVALGLFCGYQIFSLIKVIIKYYRKKKECIARAKTADINTDKGEIGE